MADIRGANRFILDTVHLAKSLDSVTARGWPDSIRAAVHQGTLKYGELMVAREIVSLTVADAKLMDWVLDVIRGRLTFLQNLYCQNLPN